MPLIKRRAPLQQSARHRPRMLRHRTEKKAAVLMIFVIIAISLGIIFAGRFLKDISGQIALSNASDTITAAINDKINEKMSEGQYDYNYLVTLQKDDAGNITAISANMARIDSRMRASCGPITNRLKPVLSTCIPNRIASAARS